MARFPEHIQKCLNTYLKVIRGNSKICYLRRVTLIAAATANSFPSVFNK